MSGSHVALELNGLTGTWNRSVSSENVPARAPEWTFDYGSTTSAPDGVAEPLPSRIGDARPLLVLPS